MPSEPTTHMALRFILSYCAIDIITLGIFLVNQKNQAEITCGGSYASQTVLIS